MQQGRRCHEVWMVYKDGILLGELYEFEKHGSDVKDSVSSSEHTR